MNETNYLRKEFGLQSPQQPISKRMTSSYMLRSSYNKMMEAGSTHGTAQVDRTRNAGGLNQDYVFNGGGGQRPRKEGLRVDTRGLGDTQDFNIVSGKSSMQTFEAMKTSIRQQETQFAQKDRMGRVKSAVNKHQVLSEHSPRDRKEAFKIQDKLTNVSSAKSIRVLRAIKRMSVDPVPFFKVA